MNTLLLLLLLAVLLPRFWFFSEKTKNWIAVGLAAIAILLFVVVGGWDWPDVYVRDGQ